MYQLVKCPNCEKLIKTRGEQYFRCDRCRIAFDIEKCLVTNLEDKRYRKRKRILVRIVDK